MKILLIGNYPNNAQQSMDRFAAMMRDGLLTAGHEVRMVRPPVVLGRLRNGASGLAKWIGYLDRFVLYPPVLRREVRWADVVHICDQANAVYIPHLKGKSHAVTCHDMLAIRAAQGEIPESPTGWSGRIYQGWILRSLRRAQQVVCVSRQTRSECLRLTSLPPDRVGIVPNALNYPYQPMPASEAEERLRGLGLTPGRPFLLHVGGNQWYKNRPGVIRLFGHLTEQLGFESFELVMAGMPWPGKLHRLVRELGIADRVREVVGASNEDLRALFSSAEAFLFPSLQEGFGWPIAEAQACGCPVVTSDCAHIT